MPRLTLSCLALTLLAHTASAQEDSVTAIPDHGFSVSYGLLSAEAFTAHTKQDVWSARYRFGNGVAVGVYGAGSDFDRFDRQGIPTDGELARQTDGVRRHIGVTAERIVRTRLADLRVGALASYHYSRTTRRGFTLQPGGGPPYHYPPLPDSVRTLQPDAGLFSQDRLRTMSLAGSITASRAVRLSKAGRFDPGVGLAVGATHVTEVDGPLPSEVASAAIFLRLPARLAVTPRVGVTLDTTVGMEYSRANSIVVSYGARRWSWFPATGASVQVDF